MADQDTLVVRRLFVLAETEWEAMRAILDRPVRVMPRLKSLLDQPSVLEKD